ncbi:MAG TPA: ornithine cyclodeaminase family protein [Dehalococcoidia bacterium]|jgi:alanine dehydrogenase|nr:ornithine cyclodeaminase family protein [Dehalococcoidia bacterium]
MIWPAPEPCEVLLLSGAELQRLLEREALVAAMAEAMRAYSTGEALVPLRTVFALPGEQVRVLATMPGAVAGKREALGAKLVSVFPANTARGLESHYGVVILFDPDTGRPQAVLDGTFITTARTAAVSAVSVELLARRDATVLAVIGAGVQARAHLWALAGVRPWREARIVSRRPERALALAEQVAPHLPFTVRALERIEDAVRGADVVVTATSATAPVLARAWLKPGVHITAVGSSTRTARELDSETVRDALLVVDSRAGALAEAGDILTPIDEGVITPEHIHAELGELVARLRPGRTRDDQVTVYKSLGMAVQDIAAAQLALARARDSGAGTLLRL